MALRGIQVLEISGLAPAPFCGMILSDFGAKVIRIDRISGTNIADSEISHGKFSLALNMKHSEGANILKRLIKSTDVILEPFRAGVMENLGLGPSELQKCNEKLIYARLTGYGQTGPMAQKAGHDINFASISGILSSLGWDNKAPSPPLNLLADFAGGGLTCALGIILALYERQISGKGQTVDCSMTRGASYLGSWVFRTQQLLWREQRGKNILDGGSYMYNTYETKDGKWMAVGALEEKFYNDLLHGLDLSSEELPYMSSDEKGKKILKEKFLEHTQEYWINVFSDLDACVTPVLSIDETTQNEHNVSQKSFSRSSDGYIVPSPEPRLSRTPGQSRLYAKPPKCGEHTFTILKEIGYSTEEIKLFAKNNVVHIGESKL